MYEIRFGLKRRPFPTTPDGSVYYPATGHEAVLGRLQRALEENEGFALLTGAPGTGKTLLGLNLMDRLEANGSSAFLTNSHFADRRGLLQAILYDLCLPHGEASEQTLRLRLTDFLLKNCEQGKKTLLVIDEAQHLCVDHLEELRLLGNLEAGSARAVQIVLLGQPGCTDILNRADLASLKQRLSLKLTIEPLGVEEAMDYLLHHLRLAGGRPERIADEAALEVLARGTHGFPRLLNQAAHQAFLLADAGDLSKVDAEAALEALAVLGLSEEQQPTTEEWHEEEERELDDLPIRLVKETCGPHSEPNIRAGSVSEGPGPRLRFRLGFSTRNRSMGRMLEALKNKDASRAAPRERPFFDDAIEHSIEIEQGVEVERGDEIDYVSEDDNAIPFIEVGPNKKMEGSNKVMAYQHPAQPRLQPEERKGEETKGRRGEETFVSIAPSTCTLRPPPSALPLAVAFEPWPTMPQLGQGVAPEIFAFHHPEHPISRQYAILLARMQEGLTVERAKVVLLIGCRSQVGTSTVLLNLAVTATQKNMSRVVVVDAHLRGPSLASRLGYACATGMEEVFQGRLALEQAVVQTAVTGLHLVPAQPISAAPVPRVEAVRWLFTWLGDHFNLVLVDSPSLEAGNELAPWIAACDCAYMVVPEGESEPSQRGLAQSLTAMGAKLRGLFHTQCK